jgi:undecaprenyl diphosphate synthase
MGLHVAIIPDGNRRWARDELAGADQKYTTDNRDELLDFFSERAPDYLDDVIVDYRDAQPELDPALHAYGHWEGSKRVEDLTAWIQEYDVDEVTVWGLSYDNAQKRDSEELDRLNRIYGTYAADMREDGSPVDRHDIEVNIVGDGSLLHEAARYELFRLEEETADNDGCRLNLAMGYDGRWELVEAARAVEQEPGLTDREAIEENLSLPQVDVLIGYGEDRSHLSHFANWQIGYATIDFPQKHWPDAEQDDLAEAIDVHRDRKKSRGR